VVGVRNHPQSPNIERDAGAFPPQQNGDAVGERVSHPKFVENVRIECCNFYHGHVGLVYVLEHVPIDRTRLFDLVASDAPDLQLFDRLLNHVPINGVKVDDVAACVLLVPERHDDKTGLLPAGHRSTAPFRRGAAGKAIPEPQYPHYRLCIDDVAVLYFPDRL